MAVSGVATPHPKPTVGDSQPSGAVRDRALCGPCPVRLRAAPCRGQPGSRPPEASRCLTQYLSFSLIFLCLSKAALSEKAMAPPLQYSCLENRMDGGAWWAAVHRVAKSRTRVSDFTFTFRFHALEKEMATHSSVLAWRIPGMGEPVGCHVWCHTESDTTEAI